MTREERKTKWSKFIASLACKQAHFLKLQATTQSSLVPSRQSARPPELRRFLRRADPASGIARKRFGFARLVINIYR